MPGKSLDLQWRTLGQGNSSARRVIRPRNVGITNSATETFPPSSAKIFGFFFQEMDWGARFEAEVGRDNSIPCPCPVPIAGLFMKRIMDLLLSAIALLLLWPLLLVIALIVKLESPGSVIYPSLRAGKEGQTFVCHKFRTMVNGADGLKNSLRYLNERQDPFFKIADDPRVTRFGHFLRQYSLDELPQFWNVLKGDMSLVGPRPHPVDDYLRYRSNDHRRLDVKPGITGLWQVTARTNPSFETCMTLDLEYIRNWNLLLDLKILMRTVPAILSGEGQ
jgi:lipopolysaccharide/colanic/teichoic acid biosynthesis glycosyltransferase